MASYVGGFSLQWQIVEYLRTARGIHTNDEIRAAVRHDSQECINTTLCRMRRLGLVERVTQGQYRVAERYAIPSELPERMVVSATLDHLKATYPQLLRQELHKRGWSQ